MATCSIDKISVVCDGGCGLICAGSQCWSWCEPVPDPIIVPAVMLLRASAVTDADEVPQGSTTLTLCAHGATKRSLVHVLQIIVGQRLESSSEAADDAEVEPFSGTLDELLTYHGLRRGDS
jgi:hypothetical protein